MNYKDIIKEIKESNKAIMCTAGIYIDSLLKPPGSLGVLEETAIKLAAISGFVKNDYDKKLILIFASDNGVVEEGVASAPKEVTAIQVGNFLNGVGGVSVLAKSAGADIRVIDVGVDAHLDLEGLYHHKIQMGTNNLKNEDAMTFKEAELSIQKGIDMVFEAYNSGYQIIGTGEMGIGNSTTSSLLLTALTDETLEITVGKGAGLSDDMFQHKKKVICEALNRYDDSTKEPLELLSRYGGFDIGALIGVYLGCAYLQIPVIVDGFIAGVSALMAYKMNPLVKDYMLLSHKSLEPGFKLVEDILEMEAPLNMKMRLGEGTGCALMFKIIDSAMAMVNHMGQLGEYNIDQNILVDIREESDFK
jgi:nicotinate-nucleotide--dimethylbenzimidazole phosphoribosyltransferase